MIYLIGIVVLVMAIFVMQVSITAWIDHLEIRKHRKDLEDD